MSQTEQTSFFAAMGTKIADTDLAVKDGLTYISAAAAMGMAGRPEVTFVDFEQKPFLECFGGALVAVDLTIPGSDLVQRTWLQVMDQNMQASALANTTLTDINNSRQRCLVKAIASVYGYGMSLYIGCDGDGVKALKMLGVNPESDLTQANPVVALLSDNGAAFIEWGVGLSVCRITDPNFTWKVIEWDGKPYREVLGNVMVDVETVYKGKRQVLSLPIMDASHAALPAKKVTVNDWNKAVMRALTKCIAFNAGYGLSVYGTEFGVDGVAAKGKNKASKVAKERKDTSVPTDSKSAEGATVQADASTDKSAPAVQDSGTQVTDPVAQVAQPEPEALPPAQAEVKSDASAQPSVQEDAPQQGTESGSVADQAPDAPQASAAANNNWPAASQEALDRFNAVMKSRREKAGVPGLLTLFEALHLSAKFAPEDKPGCYVKLVTTLATEAQGADIESLLAAIRQYNAMQYLDDPTYEQVASRLAAEILHFTCETSDEALAAAPGLLLDAGIGMDVQDVVRLAKAGNVTKETLDLLETVMPGVPA